MPKIKETALPKACDQLAQDWHSIGHIPGHQHRFEVHQHDLNRDLILVHHQDQDYTPTALEAEDPDFHFKVLRHVPDQFVNAHSVGDLFKEALEYMELEMSRLNGTEARRVGWIAY